MNDPFEGEIVKPEPRDGFYDDAERSLANRNSGTLLETLSLDITPIGTHYLLTHFDTPIINRQEHVLRLEGDFDEPFEIPMEELLSLPQVTLPVTLECAGNGRVGMSPRRYSMPWGYEAVGTSEWTGTLLWPLIANAKPNRSVIEFSFTGADFGYDKGIGHLYGRSLTVEQAKDLDVLLVYEMNGQPLLPQHGSPLRLIVPGWYGMASVKWLTEIKALSEPYNGFQQVQTYKYRNSAIDLGRPVTEILVKSLMVPPGVPDFVTRDRCLKAGTIRVEGRAWSGAGKNISEVEFGINGKWEKAKILDKVGKYAWTKWVFDWDAKPGQYILQCRATDELGCEQPKEPTWNLGGFGNNSPHSIKVFVKN